MDPSNPAARLFTKKIDQLVLVGLTPSHRQVLEIQHRHGLIDEETWRRWNERRAQGRGGIIVRPTTNPNNHVNTVQTTSIDTYSVERP
jgi:hypothetical protein